MNNKFTIEAILKASGADQFSRDFQNATESMDGITRASEKSTGGLKSFMGGVGKIAGAIGITKLVSAGFGAIRNSVDDAVSRVDTLNQFPRVLQQMGASGEEAEWAIDRLAEGIEGLPTKLDDVAGEAQRMFTILGDAELATESTLALNNAFLASGASTADASRGLEQYMQMLSTGKVDMQSWRTLQETMPYALKETAEAFGFTGEAATNDFYDALQSGEITMSEVNEKMIELSNETGGFAETALTATEGISTSWQNLQTAISRNVANVIEAYNDWATDAGFLTISEIIDKMKEAVDRAFRSIIENIPVVLDWFAILFNTITESTAFQVFKEVVVTAFDAIVEGVQLVIDWVQQLSESSSENFTHIYEVIQEVMTLVWEVIQTIWTSISEFWAEHGEQIMQVTIVVWEAIKEVIGTVVEAVFNFVMEIWGQLVTWWNENNELIRAGAEEIWTAIQHLIGSVMMIIVPIITTAWEVVKNVTMTVWEAIKTVVSNAINIVLNIITLIMAVLTGDWSAAWNAIKEIASSIWDIIKAVVEAAINVVKSIVTTILDAIKSLWDAGWTAVANKVREKFSDVVNNVRDGIRRAYDVITNWFGRFKTAGSNIVGNIADGIRGAISKVTSAVGNVLSAARNLLPFSPPKDKSSPMVGLEKNGIVDNIAQGIMNNEGEIQRAMNRALDVDIPMVNGRVSHEMNNNPSTQPAYINVNIGGQNFRGFVENISNEQGKITDLELQF